MRVAGVPLISSMTTDSGTLTRDWGTGGARLLVSDSRVAWLLLGESRRRLAARMFGVPMDKTGLVTIIALGTLAQAIREKTQGVVTPPAVPSLGGATMAVTMVKDVGHLVAGEWSRDTPLFGSLMAVVVLGTLGRPVLRLSFREVRASAHGVRLAFDHRYGHLVRRTGGHAH